jgi:hypothetical protein
MQTVRERGASDLILIMDAGRSAVSCGTSSSADVQHSSPICPAFTLAHGLTGVGLTASGLQIEQSWVHDEFFCMLVGLRGHVQQGHEP